ncbi:PAS domain S-box protein [Fulvimarina endophytica]|uniref:Blue-light-activated histidine kinase n=1 Tax=Fulvimarina endophytica TaxID=2293836 RepID=A0A371XA17_9HYPH|nr:HWE histidine kinase domain-containing protein [Fulvimarina endophytica]RFC66051.1 PAS domain S-box protein [Fulvimarina endophytica]
MPTSTKFNRALLHTITLPLDGVLGYAAVACAVGSVAVLRQMAGFELLPYLFFIPVILISSVFIGSAAGVFATFLATVLAGFSISEVGNPFMLRGQQWTTQFLFVAVNLGIVAFGANLRRSVLQLDALSEARRDALERLAAQTAERDRLATIVEQSKDFIGYADLDGRIQYVNEAGRQLIGLADDPRQTEIAHHLVADDRSRLHSEVLPTVSKEGSWAGEMRFEHASGEEPIPVRYNLFMLFDTSGEPVGYGTVTTDLRKEKAAEAQREALTRELAHRMKNTLAMVQAIAAQTLRTSSDLPAARAAISSRLSALSRAQDILMETNWKHADIRGVIDAALAPHLNGEGRFTLTGPHLELDAPRALGLSLAVHELATNATKYGALSNETGRVLIEWSSKDRSFDFAWTERGGPVVGMPGSSGFGSKLLERIVAAYFEGATSIDFEPDGARFTIKGRLGKI